MPRWLSSLLIVIGFLALVALALLPSNVSINIDIDTNVHEEETINHNHAKPSDGLPVADDGGV